MFHVALMWRVREQTGSNAAAGLAAMVGFLPQLLLGLPAGTVADLVDRRRLMIAADVARAVVAAALWYHCAAGDPPLVVMLTAAALLSTGAALFNPARDALLPELVPPDELLRANASLQLTVFLPILIGPAIAAAALAVMPVSDLFALDAATFLVSALLLLGLRHRAAPRPPDARDPLRRLRDELRVAVRLLAGERGDRKLPFFFALTAANNFVIMGPAVVGTLVFVREELQGGASEYALIESCLGAGMVAGALVVARLGARFGPGRVMCLAWIWDGLTYAALWWVRDRYVAAALIALHALAIPGIVVCRATILQQWVGAEHRGRVFGVVNAAVVGVTAISAGFVGWCTEYVAASAIFLVFGLLAASTGVVGWCYRPLRTA